MTLTLSKRIALRAQLHFRGKIPLLWLFLPKIHNLSPIKRKHQTNPSWGAFNKIAGQLILFWNKLEPLLSYSVDLKIGLGTLLPGGRKIGHSVGVLTCNLVREQWVFSWVMGIILDKWLEPWILVSALSWQSEASQMSFCEMVIPLLQPQNPVWSCGRAFWFSRDDVHGGPYHP